MSETRTIGPIRYQFLNSLPKGSLSDEDKALINDFENQNHPEKAEADEYRKEYSERLHQHNPQEDVILDPTELANQFTKAWEFLNPKHPLQLTQEMKRNLRTLNFYFCGDERFKEGCSDLSEPSLDKGIMLIGPYGNGKTKSMEVFHRVLQMVPGHSFKSFTSTEVVDRWEMCREAGDKKNFWKTMINGRCHFDDLLREREASNYGKVEIFRDILLKRYDSGAKTFISCNPRTSDNQDALEHISEKYGAIVYDRLFEMFNVIFWDGKSFRR